MSHQGEQNYEANQKSVNHGMYVMMIRANSIKNRNGMLTLYNSKTGRLKRKELINKLIPTGGVM
jgi:hypothetical protein